MKLVITSLIVALLSSSAMAADKLVCREKSGKKITVVVNPGQELPIKAKEDLDSKYEAYIEVFTNDPVMPETSEKGIIETEDVMYSFTSQNKKIQLNVFLDEMDSTTLTLNGKAYSLVCY